MSAFLAGFAVATAALSVAAEASPRVRDPVSGDKVARLTAAVATDPSRPVVLFLGSSRTGFAFHATRADDRLRTRGFPARCFNLGLPAAGPVCELVTLHRVLNTGVRPAVVLVELLPSMLHDTGTGPREQAFLTGYRLSADEVRTAARFGYSWGGVAGQWAKGRLAPWWVYRFPLWGRVAPSWLSYAVRADWGRTADAGGWNASIRDDATEEERRVGEAQARSEYAPTLAVLAPGGGAADAFRAIVETCHDRGIVVRVVLLPEGTAFRALNGPSVETRLSAFLADLDAPVIDARSWRPDLDFSDGHHLMRPGAAAFTDRLAEEVIAPALSRGGGRD